MSAAFQTVLMALNRAMACLLLGVGSSCRQMSRLGTFLPWFDIGIINTAADSNSYIHGPNHFYFPHTSYIHISTCEKRNPRCLLLQ